MSYEVYIDPEVLDKAKVHATIIQRTVNKWRGRSSGQKKRKPGDKWQDVEDWEGVRYLITFRLEAEDLCAIIGFRKAHYSKTHYWDTKKK